MTHDDDDDDDTSGVVLPWPDDGHGQPVSLLSRVGRGYLRMLESLAKDNNTVNRQTFEQNQDRA